MKRIHITGASGSGVTTLGAALAARLRVPQFDTDDFYCAKTDPPYTVKNEIPERLAHLRSAFASAPQGWNSSGWLLGWGDELVPLFDAVIFLRVPAPVRMARLARVRRRATDGA